MWVSEFVHAHVYEWGFFIVVLCFALFLSVVCDGLCVCDAVYRSLYVYPLSLMASFPVLVGM